MRRLSGNPGSPLLAQFQGWDGGHRGNGMRPQHYTAAPAKSGERKAIRKQSRKSRAIGRLAARRGGRKAMGEMSITLDATC